MSRPRNFFGGEVVGVADCAGYFSSNQTRGRTEKLRGFFAPLRMTAVNV